MDSNTTFTWLDEAINEVSDPVECQCELLREQLLSARSDLAGDMRDDFQLNLRLAWEVLDCIVNQDRRERVHRILGDLLASRE